jgi:hypothetical protein
MGNALLVAVYIAGTTLLLYGFFSNWTYDDPFITYRYAANLRNGLGFVYNSHERVLSTTTPLFTILLAVLGNLWPDLPHLANVLGMLGLAMGGLFLWDLSRTWQTPLVGWSGVLLYPTFPLLVSALGSETPIYLALCLGSFAFYARRRYEVAAGFAALAVLTRPDGVLVGLTLLIHNFLSGYHRIPWRSLALFFSLTLPWFIFAWGYFGSPIPVSLVVKQQQGTMAISQLFAPGLLSILKPYVNWRYLIVAILTIGGIIFMIRYKQHWVLFLAWTILYFLGYSVLGVSSYFWYYAPLAPAFIVVLSLGISSTKVFFVKYRPIFYYISTIIIFSTLISAQIYQLRQLRENQYRHLFINNMMATYGAIGNWLQDHTPPDATVGTLEVGIIGYYSQRSMIDFAGLIQPKVSDQFTHNATYEDSALWAVEQYRPDYLVLYEHQFPRLVQGYVQQHCKAVQQFLGNSYEYPIRITVYSCR